jgi:hypothetical protein
MELGVVKMPECQSFPLTKPLLRKVALGGPTVRRSPLSATISLLRVPGH